MNYAKKTGSGMKSIDKFLKNTAVTDFKNKNKKSFGLTAPTVTSFKEIVGESCDVHGAADFFNVHYQTIYKWLDSGLLECDCDLAPDGRRYNITFTPQHLANRLYKKKHA